MRDCAISIHSSLIDGVDPEPFLREDRVNENVSLVSQRPTGCARFSSIISVALREANDLVMEGRDIGSVVFPQTPFKFYIDASPDIRLRRREAQGQRDRITARDEADSSRRALRSSSPRTRTSSTVPT